MMRLATILFVLMISSPIVARPGEMPWIGVSKDKKGFVLEPNGKPFTPWGFNYDHDTEGRLIEDYWDKEWDKVEAHFGQMKKLGANVVRIREKDKRHLITVGLVDWSLDRPGLTSGFVPAKVAADLDFISVHLYPKSGKINEALDTLAGFAIGKPVVIEETFPLTCTPKELGEFIDGSKKHAAGWIGFYWGKSPDELRRSKTIPDAMTLGWLELFEKKAKAVAKQ